MRRTHIDYYRLMFLWGRVSRWTFYGSPSALRCFNCKMDHGPTKPSMLRSSLHSFPDTHGQCESNQGIADILMLNSVKPHSSPAFPQRSGCLRTPNGWWTPHPTSGLRMAMHSNRLSTGSQDSPTCEGIRHPFWGRGNSESDPSHVENSCWCLI